MKGKLTLLSVLICTLSWAEIPDLPEIRGLCIAAPGLDRLEQFLTFMENDLAPNGINTLILRIDFNYEYDTYPNLRDTGALSKEEVKRLVHTARDNGIQLIPQINLLGHQSWHTELTNLLKEYPEFDENPSVVLPERYEWPNEDGLYCKSYCPLHPEIHKVVFALVDEIMEVFEANAFHAGMDEVFYIGEDECPRCKGKCKAELFAGEVNKIRDHLVANNQELWIWGDRLIDGKTTGLGLWEASENDTHGAIDMIHKDVVICDWHYERAEPTAALFALKGFRVITCPWNRPEVTKAQLEMMHSFRMHSNDQIKGNYFGLMQTIWSPASVFLDQYYGKDTNPERSGQVESFNEMINFYNGSE
ncbi:MAG: family 20 glycosylhydrolase [Bacteroidales bacterium]|nr:family 20 glycosylhydrolase [Bacteroidales bacterium]